MVASLIDTTLAAFHTIRKGQCETMLGEPFDFVDENNPAKSVNEVCRPVDA
jgi:hypothetical protein